MTATIAPKVSRRAKPHGPVVAVIMTTYNHGAFIGEAVESVLAQTFAAWELIVVDDGSTDDTLEILRRFDDPRIRVVAREHLGLPALAETYRSGVELSTAPYLAILDGDDRWPADKLARQVPDFDDPEVVLSYGAGLLIDEYGCEYGLVEPSFPQSARNNRPVGTILPSLLANNAILSATVVVRRSALDAVGGFWQPPGVSYVDHPTWLLLAMQGSFAYHRTVVGSWRRHPGQWTTRTVHAGAGDVPEAAYVPLVADRFANQLTRAKTSLPSRQTLIQQHADRAILNRWRVALLFGDLPDVGRSFVELVRTGRPRLIGLALLGVAVRSGGSDLEWMQRRRNRVAWPSRRHRATHLPALDRRWVGAPSRLRQPIRIAYLAHGVEGRESGVRTKILAQAATWAELDPSIEVGIFVRCEAGVESDWVGQPHVVGVRSSRAGIIGRYVVRELLSLQVARWQPDLIYHRQSTVSPSVARLVSNIPTVVEVNSDDMEELRLRSKIRYWYARATRDRFLRQAKGLVVVTGEIARRETIAGLGRPTTVVPNSIDLADHPSVPAAHNTTPRLVFIGAPRIPWAGVDKIPRLARRFPDWQFDVIGPDRGEVPEPPPNVRIHGLLKREAYQPILARADAAIGPLALYRKQMSEASALKVAEYLAYGIPVILGNSESAFPDGAPFLLQLSNTEDNVEQSFDRIRAFVLGWMGRRVDRASIASIDSRLVERRRLDFILDMLPAAKANERRERARAATTDQVAVG
ncbi:MAG: glycosyltransferase [Chloroflexota bacterium]